MDGKRSLQRIIDIMRCHDPDIIALQETAVWRSYPREQMNLCAGALGMDYQFHPTNQMGEELYGNAVMTRFPMRLVKAAQFPSLPGFLQLEPRGAMLVEVETERGALRVINTHLGLNRRERLAQVNALLGTEWAGGDVCTEPIVVCGDFNSRPNTPAYKRICTCFQDVQIVAGNHRPRKTWSALYPVARIDHIFVSPGCDVLAVKVGNTLRERFASDHLPLVVDLRVKHKYNSDFEPAGAVPATPVREGGDEEDSRST